MQALHRSIERRRGEAAADRQRESTTASAALLPGNLNTRFTAFPIAHLAFSQTTAGSPLERRAWGCSVAFVPISAGMNFTAVDQSELTVLCFFNWQFYAMVPTEQLEQAG